MDLFGVDGGFPPLDQLLLTPTPPPACWETSRIGLRHSVLGMGPSPSLHGPVSWIWGAGCFWEEEKAHPAAGAAAVGHIGGQGPALKGTMCQVQCWAAQQKG